jgi:hypothetical protein
VEVQVVVFQIVHIRLLSLSPPQAQRLHAARVLATPELGTRSDLPPALLRHSP